MDAAFPDRLEQCANDMRRGAGAEGAPLALEIAAAEIRELRELVVHCWVHSNYKNCGYDQMTTDQKALFTAITESA